MQAQHSSRYFTKESKVALPSERIDFLVGFEQKPPEPPLGLLETAVVEDTLKRVPFAVIVRGQRYYKFLDDKYL